MRRRLPESPRWLASHGHTADAEEVIAAWELEARLENPELTLSPTVGMPETRDRGAFGEIFAPRYRGRTIMLIVFNLFQAAGYYGFASWVPTLLIAQGIAVTTSLLYTFIIALAAPAGPLLGLWFTGHLERKHLIVGAALSIATFGLLFTQARGITTVIACGVGLTLANNILSFAYHGYQPELYPTRIRAFGVGFVYSFSRLSTMFSAFIIAAILRAFGAGGVFVFIAGCMVIVALVIGLFGPRTQGRPLEQISA
jgi:putative MFS transporter